MTSITSIVYGKFTDADTFIATCLECGVEFGSFTFDGIRKAIMSNLEKGGVKCPDCRKKSCYFCGLGWIEGGHKWYAIETMKNGGSLENKPVCVLCSLEFKKSLQGELPF